MWWWTSFLFKNHLSKVHRDDDALGWVNLPQSTLNCRLMCVTQSRWCWERVNPIEVPQIDDYSVTYIRDYTGSVIIALHHSIEFHFQVQTRNSWAGGWAREKKVVFPILSGSARRAPCGDDSILFDYFWRESNHKSSRLPMNCDGRGEKWHTELISEPRWLSRRWISQNPRREMWATLFSKSRERLSRCLSQPTTTMHNRTAHKLIFFWLIYARKKRGLRRSAIYEFACDRALNANEGAPAGFCIWLPFTIAERLQDIWVLPNIFRRLRNKHERW